MQLLESLGVFQNEVFVYILMKQIINNLTNFNNNIEIFESSNLFLKPKCAYI